MIIISVRKGFWDNNEISRSDEIRKIAIGSLPKFDGPKLTQNNFLDELSGKKVLLLVHGYNNLSDDVLRAYGIIEAKIKAFTATHYDMVIGFAWPGGDDPLDYFAAKRQSSAVAPRLGGWLAKIKPKAARLDLMTHSMGTRVLLSALQVGANLKIDNAFNMASAVDNECLEPSERYHKAAKNSKTFYVFHTRHDNVLSAAYRAAEWDRALGHSGPEDAATIVKHCPQVKVINCKHVITSHGDYKNSDKVYQHITNELAGNGSLQFVTLST